MSLYIKCFYVTVKIFGIFCWTSLVSSVFFFLSPIGDFQRVHFFCKHLIQLKAMVHSQLWWHKYQRATLFHIRVCRHMCSSVFAHQLTLTCVFALQSLSWRASSHGSTADTASTSRCCRMAPWKAQRTKAAPSVSEQRGHPVTVPTYADEGVLFMTQTTHAAMGSVPPLLCQVNLKRHTSWQHSRISDHRNNSAASQQQSNGSRTDSH